MQMPRGDTFPQLTVYRPIILVPGPGFQGIMGLSQTINHPSPITADPVQGCNEGNRHGVSSITGHMFPHTVTQPEQTGNN